MNGPIEDIAQELGFQGNPFLQGLVVSIFIVGAFFGSLSSSALVDKFGCKKTLQIDSIPLIIGALLRYLVSLLRCFFVPKYMEFLLISVVCSSIRLHINQSYSAQADSLEEMLLGRFLVGIGIGVNTVLVPIYISEVHSVREFIIDVMLVIAIIQFFNSSFTFSTVGCSNKI